MELDIAGRNHALRAASPSRPGRPGRRGIDEPAVSRNPNTRAAYMNAVADFLRFEPVANLGSLAEVRSIHVSAYIEAIGDRFAPQTVKQRLAALRGLFDWLVRRRALAAGVADKIGNHSFRGTGITTYLENDGTLELAQEMANHASPRTTKLYDRRGDKITQDAVERIRIE